MREHSSCRVICTRSGISRSRWKEKTPLVLLPRVSKHRRKRRHSTKMVEVVAERRGVCLL